MPIGKFNPNGHMQELRSTFEAMEVGDSFVYERNNEHPYRVAKYLGIKICTRKIDGGGWRVWRIK